MLKFYITYNHVCNLILLVYPIQYISTVNQMFIKERIGVRDKGGRVAHPQHEPRHALSGGGPIQLCSFLTLRSL